jgi:hypothetical protein
VNQLSPTVDRRRELVALPRLYDLPSGRVTSGTLRQDDEQRDDNGRDDRRGQWAAQGQAAVSVVAKTLMTQKPRVTAGTLVNACLVMSFIR